MSRPLGYTESLFAALHEASGSHVIRLAVYMRGAPDAATIAVAMALLEARHPMLRAHLHAGRGGYRFVLSPDTAPAFEIRHAGDGHSVDTVIAEGDGLTFPAGSPLYRAVFVLDPDRGRSALVWFSHHAISDGLAVDMITTELCALIDALAAGRPVELEAVAGAALPAPFEARIGSRRPVLRFATSLARDAVARIGVPRMPHAARPPVAARRPRGLFLILSPEQTGRARTHAGAAGTGLTEYLGAALLKATAAELGRSPARLPFYIPVDCRAHMDGGARLNRKVFALGTHMACVYPEVDAAARTSLIARRLRGHLQDPALADPGSALVERFPGWFVRTELHRRAARSGAFLHGIAFTHAGRHKIPSDAAICADVRFGGMTVRDGCLMMSGISFLNAGCLVLALSYTDPLMPDAAAEAFAGRVAAALGEPDIFTTRSFDAVFAEVTAKGRFPSLRASADRMAASGPAAAANPRRITPPLPAAAPSAP